MITVDSYGRTLVKIDAPFLKNQQLFLNCVVRFLVKFKLLGHVGAYRMENTTVAAPASSCNRTCPAPASLASFSALKFLENSGVLNSSV